MYEYIFFDLDGTLTDSKEGVLDCLRYTMAALRVPVPEESALLKFIGPPLQESFMEYCGFDRETAQTALRLFRDRYVPAGLFNNRPAPGVTDMLARLKARGRTLALASSKAESQCVSLCDHFGFTPHLAAITGSPDQGDWSKADVLREAMARLNLKDPSRALMVGDRKYDVAGARACGMDCIGVEFFGYALPGELAEAGAVAVVQTTAALESFILNH